MQEIIQIGVIKVVRTMKRIEIPSTPSLNLIKLFIQFFSSGYGDPVINRTMPSYALAVCCRSDLARANSESQSGEQGLLPGTQTRRVYPRLDLINIDLFLSNID